MSGPGTYLLDLFPRAGFRWRRGQGSPRILRSDKRDAGVQSALIDLIGQGGRVRKRDAQQVVVEAVANTAKMIKDAEFGIGPDEGIIDFLERSAKCSEFSQAIPEDVWVELVYQIAHARNEYKRRTPQAQQDGDADQLTALAFAVDDLLSAAGHQWDWMTLEIYTYPHLMGGEAVDYEIDEEDEDSEEDVGGGVVEGGGMAVDRAEEVEEQDKAERELPRRMGELSIRDADGDVEMGM